MKETEKIFMLFDQFLKERGRTQEELSEEEFFTLFNEFKNDYNSNMYQISDLGKIEESDDLYEQALEADDYDEKVHLLEQALEVNPDNFDAKIELVVETNPDYEACMQLEVLLLKERERLEKEENITDEDHGHFYGIIETRPYMRGKYRLAHLYNKCGMYRLAMEECEEILYLNENDNLGARYLLISVYAQLCKLDDTLDLYERYEEESLSMLLYLCACSYRCGEWMLASTYLDRILEVFPAFVIAVGSDEDAFEELLNAEEEIPGYYRRNSVNEMFLAIELQPEIFENESFNEWLNFEFIRIQKEVEAQIKH